MKWRGIVYGLACAYVVATLPLALVVAQSWLLRFEVQQQAAYFFAHVRRPHAVYVGDSQTAWRAWGDPTSINLASAGHTIRQISRQLPHAARFRPDCVHVMAGTNDLLIGADDAAILADYDRLLDTARAVGLRCLKVVAIPIFREPWADRRVFALNAALGERVAAHGYRFTDINAELTAARGTAFKDAAHLSPVGDRIRLRAERAATAAKPETIALSAAPARSPARER